MFKLLQIIFTIILATWSTMVKINIKFQSKLNMLKNGNRTNTMQCWNAKLNKLNFVQKETNNWLVLIT